MKQDSEDYFKELNESWAINLPRAKFGQGDCVSSSRVSTTKKPMLDSDLEAVIGQKVERFACDSRARRKGHDCSSTYGQREPLER